jgi:hypothetical protein
MMVYEESEEFITFKILPRRRGRIMGRYYNWCEQLSTKKKNWGKDVIVLPQGYEEYEHKKRGNFIIMKLKKVI